MVEYTEGDELRLGVYTMQSFGDPHVRPLCTWSEEIGLRECLWDEDAEPVALSRIHRALDMNEVEISERQMGGGLGLGNPHGEHGEDCYDLRQVKLSKGVVLVVREDREVFW